MLPSLLLFLSTGQLARPPPHRSVRVQQRSTLRHPGLTLLRQLWLQSSSHPCPRCHRSRFERSRLLPRTLRTPFVLSGTDRRRPGSVSSPPRQPSTAHPPSS